MVHKIGADLALNHGALVWENGDVLFTYSSGAGMQSSAEGLYQRAKKLADKVPGYATVVIDWDNNSGSWGLNPKVALLMTVLIISFRTLLRERGIEVKTVTPRVIRKCLELPAKAKKVDVHLKMDELALCPEHFSVYKGDLLGDVKDALLLASLFECAEGK